MCVKFDQKAKANAMMYNGMLYPTVSVKVTEGFRTVF